MTTSYFGQSRTQRGRLLGSIVETQNFRDGLESGPSGSWAAIPAGLITGLEDGDKALRVDAGKSVYLQNVSGGYVQKGETMLVHFKVSGTGPQAVLALQTGSGALFTRWGLMYSGGKIYRQKVVNDTTPVTTNTEIIASAPADKWYVAQISVWAAGQDFVLHVWQRDDPSVNGFSTEGVDSSDRQWYFYANCASGTLWLDEYSEGVLYSVDLTSYQSDSIALSSSDLPRPVGGGIPFYDMLADWTRPVLQVSRVYSGSTLWTGTRTEYHYRTEFQGSAQYGNLTQRVVSYWDGSQWQDQRLEFINYYPNATSYLVGLEAIHTYLDFGHFCFLEQNTADWYKKTWICMNKHGFWS